MIEWPADVVDDMNNALKILIDMLEALHTLSEGFECVTEESIEIRKLTESAKYCKRVFEGEEVMDEKIIFTLKGKDAALFNFSLLILNDMEKYDAIATIMRAGAVGVLNEFNNASKSCQK